MIKASKLSAKTSSSAAPKPDLRVGLHVSAAAQHAEALMPSEEDGFISKRTESGNSYGSLETYINTWNASDMAEVSSNPKPHPAGPSALARRLYEVGAAADRLGRAVHAADQTTKVKFQLFYFLTSAKHMPLPSPRDSG